MPRPSIHHPTDGMPLPDKWPSFLRVLSYNIFLRPPAPLFTHNTDDDRKDERLSRFVKQHLQNYDLVCLQEAFGAFSTRRDGLIVRAAKKGFHHWHKSSTNVRPQFLIDGGLLIL